VFREFGESEVSEMKKLGTDQQFGIRISPAVLRFPTIESRGEPLFRSSLLDGGFSFLALS
jgi:hypothetical protein